MHHCSTSAPQTRVAPSPFDGSTGNITLRSCDGVDFYCFSQILITASSIFADMVAIGNANPDPSSSTADRPIVPVSEDSRTLDALLRCIYLIPKPARPQSLEDVAPLLEASLKYMMDFPALVLKEELITFAQALPMQVWAIGCRLMLEDAARAGAERMLRYKDLESYTHLHEFVPIEEFVRMADARGVSAADYCRLRIYHHRRGEVEEGFSFTVPLPRQMQDQPAPGDLNMPWDFFSAESIALPDTMCHAADGVSFPAHRGLLCMSSPILKEKILEDSRIAREQGIDQSEYHLPFMEESPVLAYLLRLCYPGDAPLPENHHLFLVILKAAEKYDMTRIINLLTVKWYSVAVARPASAYFAALRYGFPELARVAARQVPRAASPTALLYVPEMEHAPAIDWQWLDEYWAATEAAVRRVRVSSEKLWRAEPALAWPLSHESLIQLKEARLRQTMKKPPHDRGHPCQAACWKRGAVWLHGRRDELLAELRQRSSAQDVPTVEELMRRSVAPTLSEKPWCTCCFNVAQDIVRLGTVFRERMLSELDEVALIA